MRRGTQLRFRASAATLAGFGIARTVGLALAVISGFALAAPAAGVAQTPPIEVGPGIFLAAASDLPPPEGSPVGDGAVARRRGSAPGGGRTEMITGGSKTSISRWPWQVSISYLPIGPDKYDSHNCGGSLVAPRIVVTAAHCMSLGSPSFSIPPDQFGVTSGRTRLRGDRGQELAVSDYFWFVDADGEALWKREPPQWDVAFMLLESPSRQRTIKIAGPSEAGIWIPGQRAFVTGWGTTRAGTDDEADGPVSNVLREARVKLISDSACRDAYGPGIVIETAVCAGLPRGGADACAGDSGGPLVVPISGHRRYRLVGDVSYASGCGLPKTPGVYGRLAGDPIRGALATGIRLISGADVVGSDAAPPNRFRLESRRRIYRRGGARLAVQVPGRGVVRLASTGRLRRSSSYPTEAGRTRLGLRLRHPAERRLLERGAGSMQVRIRITYTPFDGEPKTVSRRTTLLPRR